MTTPFFAKNPHNFLIWNWLSIKTIIYTAELPLKSKTIDTILPPIKDPDISNTLSKIVDRLQPLLGICLKISGLIKALELLPSPEKIVFPELIKNEIYDDLCKQMREKKEILLPLGWLLPKPYNGHCILCKINAPTQADANGGRLQIKLFNHIHTVSDKDNPHSGIPTSYTSSSEADLSTILNDAFKILPLQIPENLLLRLRLSEQEKSEGKISRKTAIFLCQVHHTKLGRERMENKEESPLDYIPFKAGPICVPSAFRMLLYTLAKEEAEKSKKPLSFHKELKNSCECLMGQFKDYTMAVFQGLGLDFPLLKA
ncbi:MAG: hypothetical protein WB791_10265 [Waddliaceae bacterium]